MTRINESMKYNVELVQWCNIVAAEINELTATMEDVERLVDVVGEANEALIGLLKAIEGAKKSIRDMGPVQGNQWAAMVTTTQRTTLDQGKAKSMLGDNAPMRTTDVTSVKFGSLFR